MKLHSMHNLLTRIIRSLALSVLTVGCLFCSLPNEALAAEAQKSVLLIYDTRSDMLGNIVVDRAIRKVLNEEFGFNLDIRNEYFEASPSPEEDFPVFLSWLRRKYAGRTFDVVVPVGITSLQFVADHGKELFRGAQVVYWGRRAGLDNWGSESPITGVVAPQMEEQVKATLTFIQTLQPDLERLIVVTGASALDQDWEAAARRELSSLEGRLAATYLAGLSVEEVLKRIENLPTKTAVLFLTIREDGAGRRLLRTQILEEIVNAATAPVYLTSALYLDTGVVGGALLDQEAMAVEAARLVGRLLRGEDIRKMPVQETSLVPMANGGALNRWRLPQGRLPHGTVVKYIDPSVWALYKWHIIGVILLCLLEGGLIVALLVQRASRRKAEKETSESKRLLQSTIDALNARIALLDQNGTVIAVNRQWKSFLEANPHAGRIDSVGYNYIEACGSNPECEEARIVSDGIRRLMSGEQEYFRCIYPSVQPSGTTWFQVRVNRFDLYGVPRLVLAYEDVTEIKQAHDAQQQLTSLLMRAQDEERRRIARDLHDATVQNIVAIKANLMLVEKGPQALEARAAEMVQESMSLCNLAIQELRTLCYLLHPPFLDEAGLVPALQWFVRGFSQRSGIQVQLTVREDIGRLPTDVATALFRVVQESLTNIHRHSGSKSAIIWVGKEQGEVILQVKDEGHGFSLPADPDLRDGMVLAGVGIPGMRQRLRQFGGELEIESTGRGTTVNARVSISEDRYHAYSAGR